MKKMLIALILAFACMAAIAGQVVIVTAAKLNVRAMPAIEAPILGQLSDGDRLIVIPVSQGWANIAPVTGINGSVSRRYLRLLDQHTAIPERQKDTNYRPLSLLLVLVLTIFLAKAFVHRSRKKDPVHWDTEPVFRSAAVSATSSTKYQGHATKARSDLYDASRTKGLGIVGSTNRSRREIGGAEDRMTSAIPNAVQEPSVCFWPQPEVSRQVRPAERTKQKMARERGPFVRRNRILIPFRA